ncbi:MAG TPA: aminotransferase class III-fold pyridoxal phosphate-dependent enzyme [Gammaproteobacteria bacterium]|nr:aminotransferase class III-fold pyridoxal phosphate-dependent enzyme [Gammaproteobacteria bacterium]
MTRSLKKSNEHFQKAIKKLPLGVTSNFRYWGDEDTIYVDRASGCRIRDIDGNEYIDYRLAYGPYILGYADPRVDQAAREGMEIGGVFALSTELEYEVAQKISSMVPSAELVRFSNSGTEAVLAALRVARAYSNRDEYIMLEGGYHGVSDSALWDIDLDDWDPTTGEPEITSSSKGVPERLSKMVHLVPMNDANRLEDLLKKKHNEIGALLIEPILGNCCSISADQDYMTSVRELCTKYDVVLIIDEVKTGFRVAKGGVQELYGIEADLCTYAKSIANGYPISALCGKEEMMRLIKYGGVLHGGTFTAHSVAISAANKTLEIIESTDALDTVCDYGLQLRKGLSKILSDYDTPHSFTGHPSMSGLFLSENPPTNARDFRSSNYPLYEKLAEELLEYGVLCEFDPREPWFICESHAKDALKPTLDAFEAAAEVTLK